MDKKNWKLETMAVQGDYVAGNSESRVLPLYQSTTYRYDTCDELAKVFDLEQNTCMYTRLANPTSNAYEAKLNMMDGGVGAMATASGMAATAITIMNIAKKGDSILAAATIYGGSVTLFSTTFPDLGIDVIFFDPDAPAEEIIALARPDTKAIFGETIGNPAINVLDFDKFKYISETLDIPFIVDNTFATPILCKPLELGAHIVVYSTSKYIDGHATARSFNENKNLTLKTEERHVTNATPSFSLTVKSPVKDSVSASDSVASVTPAVVPSSVPTPSLPSVSWGVPVPVQAMVPTSMSEASKAARIGFTLFFILFPP